MKAVDSGSDSDRKRSRSRSRSPAKFREGDKVEARLSGQSKWSKAKVRRVRDDTYDLEMDAPSSAYRKLQEAMGWLGAHFTENDVVLDAGAAPGGWSHVALKQGAKVYAIDRGKMDPALLNHALLTHLRKDAFATSCPEKITFLICDIIEAPDRVLGWLKEQVQHNPLRAFIVTLKLKKPLNFTIKKGELLTVLGPSGCGKTTLLNIAAGFIRPTSGTIKLGNNEINGPGVDRGMVFQQGALFEWLTVSENVNFGLRMKKDDPIKTAKKVDEWLDIVGLKGFGNTPTYQLSGGMQQRVALARCLINDPDLILMDEPLGALDALTREKMQSLVLKIWKETGKTIILITHSVEEALLLGERLYVMAPRPGRIHKEYNLPFAEMGLKQDLREIKKDKEFSSKREEILSMIWNMEEEIMGKDN